MSRTSTLVPLARYALALGDDALVLAHRCGEWITRAPQLEEDVALGNIGLDLLGQARTLLSYAGEVEGEGRDEDDLAYLREQREFTNVHLVEHPNQDFAVSMARLLVFAAYQYELYTRLSSSRDETLAGVAGKAVKEVDYHLDHATSWVLRLGDGTDLSHEKMQAALERIWPLVPELFDGSWVDPALVADGVAVDPATLREPAMERVTAVVTQATLTVPDRLARVTGGRDGIHSHALGDLLAEMQYLHRTHPGVSW